MSTVEEPKDQILKGDTAKKEENKKEKSSEIKKEKVPD